MKKFTNKEIWYIVFPILLSLLMEHLIGVTDTAFLGRLGGRDSEIALGASALGGVYYMAVFMLGFGFSIGAQILIARRNGEGRYLEIGPIVQQSTLFLIFLATFVFTLSKLASPYILRHIISSPEVYDATMEYLNWRVYGFFFIFVAVIFRAFYVGVTNTKILTINSIVMVLSNVVLNYGLIFGKFGLPAMGIAGAAIASCIAEFVSMLFFVIYTWTSVNWRKYDLFLFKRFNLKQLGHVLNLSSWTMIQQFLVVGTWFMFFIAIEHHGERPLAVTNIVRSVSSLLFITVGAFATSGSSLISNLMGAERSQYVLSTAWRITKMCYMLILPLIAILILFPKIILRIYTDDPGLIEAAVPSMQVMASSYLFMTLGFIWFNAVSGTGNTRSAFGLELIAITIYSAAVYYIVVYLKADVAICWTTEHIYGTSMFLLSIIYMYRANWRSKKI